MADNTQVTNGTGDSIRDKDRAGVKTQIVGLDVGIGTGTESLMSVSNPAPVGEVDITQTGNISAVDSASTSATSNPVASIPAYTQTRYTGTPTANSSVSLLTPTWAETSFSFDVSGTFVGTLQIERTVDGITWTAVAAFIAGSPIPTTAIIAPASGHGNDSSTAGIRLRAISWTSGTATVFIRTGPGVGTITIGNPIKLSDAANPTQQAKISASGAVEVNIASSLGSTTNSTGNLSAVSATATTQAATNTSGIISDVSSSGNATIVVITTGTVNATLIFEASIDSSGTSTSWFPIDATRSDGSAVETRALVTGTTAQAWNIMSPGYRLLRVRLMSATTIGTIAGTIVPGPMLYDPSPSVTQNPLASLQGPSATTAFVPGSVSTPAYVTGTAIVATTTALIAAPGAGLSIYVTDMEGSNEGAAASRISLLEGTTVKYARWMAASGGGFVNNLKTPWKLPANTALNYGNSVATTFHLTVNYYVAP